MLPHWILIADDDPEDQEMIIEVINQMDNSIHIETVSDGREALTKLTALSPHELPALVLLDYKMPYLNASEILESLAGDERFTTIPKMVWSTSGRELDIQRCLKAGASKYFVKPSRSIELRQIVQEILESCYIGK